MRGEKDNEPRLKYQLLLCESQESKGKGRLGGEHKSMHDHYNFCETQHGIQINILKYGNVISELGRLRSSHTHFVPVLVS